MAAVPLQNFMSEQALGCLASAQQGVHMQMLAAKVVVHTCVIVATASCRVKLYVWSPCDSARCPCQSEVAGVLTQNVHCPSASRHSLCVHLSGKTLVSWR